jgi:hypothetical protein
MPNSAAQVWFPTMLVPSQPSLAALVIANFIAEQRHEVVGVPEVRLLVGVRRRT